MPRDTPMITATEIKRRLAGTRMPADPLKVVFPETKPRIPQAVREMMVAELTPAGVLIPIIERGASLSVLLTERSLDLKHHPGQVSFPGGRMETSDFDIRATALRETHEEVGLLLTEADACIGRLSDLNARPHKGALGMAVSPFVFRLDRQVKFRPNYEVAETVWVPLEFLLDTANRETMVWERKGLKIPMSCYFYEGRRIWGLSLMMLDELMDLVEGSNPARKAWRR